MLKQYSLHYLKFIYHFFNCLLRQSQAYLRLTPFVRGKIFFLDKRKGRFFYLYSRGFADSQTADEIYTKSDYDIGFLARANDISDKYHDMVARGKTPLIIDCGANIGLASRYFAQCYPAAKIVAVEPDKSNIEMAKKHCANLSNVDLRLAAVGAEAGFAEITNSDASSNAFQVKRTAQTGGLQFVTINQLLGEESNTELFMVKIDIEGFERDLFVKNTGWLTDCYLLIIELHDWMLPRSASSNSFLRAVSLESRDFVFRRENVFSISNR